MSCGRRGRNLSSNAISGSLPGNWGWADTFPLLEVLTLDGNRLTGSLPPGYGTAGAFKALLVLNLDHNRLWGARPPGSRHSSGSCLAGRWTSFLSVTCHLPPWHRMGCTRMRIC